MSEYKPVDHRANKYFTLEEDEEELDRQRQREKSIGAAQQFRVSKNVDKESREKPVASRFSNLG